MLEYYPLFSLFTNEYMIGWNYLSKSMNPSIIIHKSNANSILNVVSKQYKTLSVASMNYSKLFIALIEENVMLNRSSSYDLYNSIGFLLDILLLN